MTHYVLFVIHHATRAVTIAGVTTTPDAAFMAQVARNLTDEVDGFLRGTRYLILDLDTKFTDQFQRIVQDAGVEVVHAAYQAPNMNAIAERWVLSIKSECLDRIILFGKDHRGRVLPEFAEHYHAERPHPGLGNELVVPEPHAGSTTDEAQNNQRIAPTPCLLRPIASTRDPA